MPETGLRIVSLSRHSLRFKIISMLLICAVAVLLLNMLYSYLSQKRQLQHELDQAATNVVDRLAFTMAQPLWNFDQKHLEQLELQELRNPAVLSVLVLPTDKELSVGRRKMEEDPAGIQGFSAISSPVAVKESQRHLERPIIYDEMTIGTVHVVLTDTPIRHKLTSLLVQQTLQALCFLTSISLLTYLGLSKILLAPLQELHEITHAYGKGDLTPRVTICSADELGQLGATLNLMAGQLSATITGLQEAEDNLRSMNRRLYDIVEFIPDAMFVTDSSGVIIAWNQAIRELTGVPAEQMLGKGQHEYALPFFGERRPILIDLLDLTDEVIEARYKFVRRMGDKVYAESLIPVLNTREQVHLWGVAAPLYDSEGSRCGAIEVIRDVTELKRAEIALLENAAFRKRVFESSQIPMVIMEAETSRFIDCNPAAAQMYHFASVEETLGKTPRDVSAPLQYDGTPSDEKSAEYVGTALKEGLVIFEWRHQRPDGELWDAEVHLMSFISGDKQLLQFTLQDITERKKTAALMVQTEKMMMVGGLAAGMAHEINNPLGIITQAAQNIQRRLDPVLDANRTVADQLSLDLDKVQQYLERRQINTFAQSIREATDRAARIIANMLKFSRQSESHTEYVELCLLFEQVLELAASDYDLKKNYDFKRISIVQEVAPDLPKIPVSVLEIEQVLLNLLKNAAQAMYQAHTSSPQIILRAASENDFVMIEVEDNGPGMSPEVQKRIFEPFYTTKEVGQGTGLGLSVSYSIIANNHHGSIEVSSQYGHGSCFRIRLPLQRGVVTNQGVSV